MQHQGSQQQLKELFEQFGKVHEVTVPKNKATNSTKGFAFVLFENGLSADRFVSETAPNELCSIMIEPVM